MKSSNNSVYKEWLFRVWLASSDTGLWSVTFRSLYLSRRWQGASLSEPASWAVSLWLSYCCLQSTKNVLLIH